MSKQREIFKRNIMMFGEEAFLRLQKSTVAVIGIGGVGAMAAETLVRSGIGTLRIVDCDVIKATDINRHLFASSKNINAPKVEAAREHLLAINPDLNLDCHHVFFHTETATELITADCDYVIDAIDSLNPKVELLSFCMQKGVPVISAMGAAGKSDPSAVCVSLLSETTICPLARAVRKKLRLKGISTDIPVVYSTESQKKGFDLADNTQYETTGTYIRGRPRRSLPSLPIIPALFGIYSAHHVIMKLANLGNADDHTKNDS